jgi:hypothetical protein
MRLLAQAHGASFCLLCYPSCGRWLRHFFGAAVVSLSSVTLKPQVHVLCMTPWTEADQTAASYARMVQKVLQEWEIDKSTISYANTDNCNTMIACFRDFFPEWVKLPCSCHWLQLVVLECLTGSFAPKEIADFIGRQVHGKLHAI